MASNERDTTEWHQEIKEALLTESARFTSFECHSAHYTRILYLRPFFCSLCVPGPL